MALARIITRFAEDSQPLAEDLRARGFEVQTRSPEETPSEPADLEITLEECTPAEVLMRASRVAQGVHVFIAPGAMTEDARPVRVAPLVPKPGVIAKPVPEPLSKPVFSRAQADREPADAAIEAMVSRPEPVMPPQPEPAGIAISDLEMQREAVEDIAAMTSHPEPVMPPQPEPVFAVVSDVEAQSEAQSETRSEAVDELRAVTSAPEPFRPLDSERVRHWPIRQPVATEAEMPAEEEQAAIYQAEVRSETVVGQPQPEPIRIVQGAASHRTGARGYRIAVERLSRNDKLFWRAAIGAGLATVAALLLVLSAPHSAPLPAGLVQGSGDTQRQVPFAKPKRSAKVRTRTRTFATGSPALSKVEASTVKPATAVKRPAPKNAGGEAAESKVTLASTKVKSKSQYGSSPNSEADVVAKDTVIRYGNPPATPAEPARK